MSVLFHTIIVYGIYFATLQPFQEEQRDPQNKVLPLNMLIAQCQHASRLNTHRLTERTRTL
jgi:hypothetical protein